MHVKDNILILKNKKLHVLPNSDDLIGVCKKFSIIEEIEEVSFESDGNYEIWLKINCQGKVGYANIDATEVYGGDEFLQKNRLNLIKFYEFDSKIRGMFNSVENEGVNQISLVVTTSIKEFKIEISDEHNTELEKRLFNTVQKVNENTFQITDKKNNRWRIVKKDSNKIIVKVLKDDMYKYVDGKILHQIM